MTNRAKLDGFLSMWLKKCAVSTHEVVVRAILPFVCLAHGVRLALVPTIIANIQNGLLKVATTFLKTPTKTPRVRLAYTYLVEWYGLHFPALMTLMPLFSATEPFVRNLVECT